MKTLRELVVDLPAKDNENADAFRIRTPDGIKAISRGEFMSDVYQLGGWLIANGMKGSICIYGADCYEWAVAHVALTCGAGIAVGLDKELSPKELAGQIRQCDANTLLYTRRYDVQAKTVQEFAEYDLQCFCIDELLIALRGSEQDYSELYAQRNHEFDDVVAIFFTSGTTGTTKGIQLTHRNIVSSIIGLDDWAGYNETDVLLQVLPMHHCYACICGLYVILMMRSTICICDSMRRIVDNIRLFKPNRLHAVPMIFGMLLKAVLASGKTMEEFFGTKFRSVISGGSTLPKEIWEAYLKYGVDIYNGYGITECTSAIIIEDKAHSRPGSIGKPIRTCQVQIIDGEICVCGDVVFKGYLNDDEATKSVLYDGWFHTGDLGFIDKEGFITITGRKKNLIILENGKNVSPEELERDLSLQIPQIQEVQVYELNGYIAAEIYPGLEITTGTQEFFISVIAAFNRKQPLHRQIRQVIVRDQPFPRTSTQKMIRKHVGK